MTRVFQIIQEEAMEKGKKEEKRKITEIMLRKSYDIADIMEITGLTRVEIEEIQKDMLVLQ